MKHCDKQIHLIGTNGNGIILYDGKTFEKISIEGLGPFNVVSEIVEGKAGYLWFGTDN